MKTALKLCLVAAALVAKTSFAAITVYGDETSFGLAVSGITEGTFSEVGGFGYDLPTSVSTAGVTFSALSGTLYIYDPIAQPAYAPSTFISVQDGAPSTANVLKAMHAGTTAIGFSYGDYVNNSGSTLSVTITTTSGVEPAITSVALPGLPLKFVGFTSTSAIKSVVFTQTSTNAAGFDVTRVLVGTALPVPEPSTYAMFGAGLALLGMIGRRRSRKN